MGHKIYLTFIQKQSDQYNHYIVPGTQITRNTSTGDPGPGQVEKDKQYFYEAEKYFWK